MATFIARISKRSGGFLPLASLLRMPHVNRVKQTDLRQLQILARRHGILLHYLDMAGARQQTPPDVLKAVLTALGFPAGNAREISDSLHETHVRELRRCIEPVVVAWDNRPAKIRLSLPKEHRAIHCRLRLESGDERRFSVEWGAREPCVRCSAPSWKASVANDSPPFDIHAARVRRMPGTFRNTRARVRPISILELTLPSLPFGYHDLEIVTTEGVFRSLIISAPSKTYAEAGARKNWGIFLPMYAVHSETSWGAGNFSDWSKLSKWAGARGANVAATLPLLASFLDFPSCEPSPYSPASRLFWNEFYIDVTTAPEFANCPAAQKLVSSRGFQTRLGAFRKNRMVNYAAEWNARREVLELLAEDFFRRRSTRYDDFEKFLHAHPQFDDYARFRAVCDRTKKSWLNWPARLRDGQLRSGDWRESDRRFHLYAQWIAREQLGQLAESSRRSGVSLYLDLPLGVNSDGYDLWRFRDTFALDAAAGAPPDMFFTKGQNWGFAPLHPQRIRENRYEYVRDFLRLQMSQTGLLRIDHVMGLHRLYWIPRGFSADQGAYVSYRSDESYAIFSIESHRHKTRLIGENLGTVPPEVNQVMRRHRLRETYVVQYELRPDARRALHPPPALSTASVNTHDMPTFAAFWTGRDIEDRRQLGLIPNGKVAEERQNRRKLNTCLVKFLSRHGYLKRGQPEPRHVFAAVLAWLGASGAEMVLANLEDSWLEPKPQNVPGTSVERPNWRNKTRFSLEEIFARRDVTRLLHALNKSRGSNRRR